MTQAQLEQRIKQWTGAKTADYGALCNDVAQLKLQKGHIAEAQQMFHQALQVTEQAQVQAVNSDVSDDDWESSWQDNLQQLQQPQRALPKPKPKQVPTAQYLQPSANLSKSQKETDYHDPEELTVPFDGAHLLECYGMTQYDTVLSIERFLQQMQWSSVCPVVRSVDDTHAVIVCANPADARSLVHASSQPSCKWRMQPFDKGCTKSKALSPGELQPPRIRQKTTAAVARRLIGNALSNSGVHDKTGELQLKAQREQNKAAKAEKQKQLDAAWGDD
ncbi:hypothetical protein WJX77_003640 [Trebouxia sp. C0004]